jgi:hypothetical protein
VDDTQGVLETMAPRLLDSLRSYLQPGPELRNQQRWPWAYPVRLYPVLPGLELAEPIDAQARNLSQGGISILSPREPPSASLYLHFPHPPNSRGDAFDAVAYALLARVVRVQPWESGWFELGAVFPR